MDFRTAAKYASLLSKDYAEDVFALLVNYQAISASEVAARLNLHIKTAQDFLESLAQLGILSKEEVLENRMKTRTIQKRLLDPSEVADLALFLASDEAKGITGQAINIDGGLVMH